MAENLIFDNLIIDRVVEAWTENANAQMQFLLNNIQNVTITGSSESKDKTDARGALIKRFYTGKSVEVSMEAAVLSLSQLGVQFGGAPEFAAASKKIRGPREFHIPSGVTTYTLPVAPIEGGLKYIYKLMPNGGLGQEFALNTEASATEFAYDKSKNQITLPVDVDGPFCVAYETETPSGIRLVNRSDKFPSTTKLVMKVACVDPCSIGTLRMAYITFPSFQVSPDVELSLTTDAAFQFNGVAQVDYCSEEKELYEIFMSADDTEADASK